ncbi:MAG: hypothetical protein HRU29_01810 [Rhizobiales bacterium]|nr:hypothetical protein [Hyphomicrobiales bacterium]NRB13111.1 hypothetical protein [Hyphomicrobiales bacterium]
MTLIREITISKFENGKLDVEGFEGETFEDVEWQLGAGNNFEPKIGSKGLAILVGGSAERLRVISIDDHADGSPIAFLDSRGQKIELGSASIKIVSPLKIEINAPEVFINGILQAGD